MNTDLKQKFFREVIESIDKLRVKAIQDNLQTYESDLYEIQQLIFKAQDEAENILQVNNCGLRWVKASNKPIEDGKYCAKFLVGYAAVYFKNDNWYWTEHDGDTIICDLDFEYLEETKAQQTSPVDVQEQKPDQNIRAATIAYMELPTHQKLEVWQKLNYPERFNKDITIYDNDKKFFEWVKRSNKKIELIDELLSRLTQTSNPQIGDKKKFECYEILQVRAGNRFDCGEQCEECRIEEANKKRMGDVGNNQQ
jgi:hypothetical protein